MTGTKDDRRLQCCTHAGGGRTGGTAALARRTLMRMVGLLAMVLIAVIAGGSLSAAVHAATLPFDEGRTASATAHVDVDRARLNEAARAMTQLAQATPDASTPAAPATPATTTAPAATPTTTAPPATPTTPTTSPSTPPPPAASPPPKAPPAPDLSTPSGRLRAAIDLLKANNYGKTIKAIGLIATSGVDHAPVILKAMSRRRVYLNRKTGEIAYRDGKAHFAFMTGEPVSGRPKGARSVRVNNRVRNIIKRALGTLQLRAKDPAARLRAATSVFQTRDKALRSDLETLIAEESDPTIKARLSQARAAIILKHGGSTSAKLGAIETLRARADRPALVAINPALNDGEERVSQAAKAAIAAIEQRLTYIAYAQNVWYGLSLGSVLLLAAIGLAITFGVMGVINMAHGEMVMIGAYTTFVVQEGFRAYAPDLFDYSLLVALPTAFAMAGLVGIAIERGIIQFLYGRPLETLLATWGVSLILQQAVRTIFGPTNREVGNPSFMSGGFEFMGLAITYNRLWIIVFALVVFVSLLLLLRLTTLGLRMRAVTQNRRMAASTGIRTGYIDALTFGLGSGIAGIAGVALSQIDNVSPNLGQNYIVDSFLVVVFGGVGNLWGTLVSALTLGITNKVLEPMAGAVLAKIFILVLLILFIQKRPRGLFALKGRAVET
ncbi:MAG: urea ABC transporter permease subunit UrtB [Pseudomonadota bacterium]